MEQTFQALGGILLKAIPTAIILVILHLYLKFTLFKPLKKSLRERERLTGGARKAAEESLAAVDRKAKEYEAKFREARAEVYKQQEETRKQWLQDQAAHIAEAHNRTRASIEEARSQISAETASAQQNLQESSQALADRIADRVLTRREGEAA
jgi:F0F1-type ATP synthase membrane subunit b/b'